MNFISVETYSIMQETFQEQFYTKLKKMPDTQEDLSTGNTG